MRSRSDTEVVTPAQIGVVTFALQNGTREIHELSAQRVADSGYAAVTSTLLKGHSVLRLCIINPLTTEADIRETIDRLATAV